MGKKREEKNNRKKKKEETGKAVCYQRPYKLGLPTSTVDLKQTQTTSMDRLQPYLFLHTRSYICSHTHPLPQSAGSPGLLMNGTGLARSSSHLPEVGRGHSPWKTGQPRSEYSGFAVCMCSSHRHSSAEPEEDRQAWQSVCQHFLSADQLSSSHSAWERGFLPRNMSKYGLLSILKISFCY